MKIKLCVLDKFSFNPEAFENSVKMLKVACSACLPVIAIVALSA